MIDVIGTIYATTSVADASIEANTPAGTDETGELIMNPPVPVEGFHVNSSVIIEAWEQYRVEPKTPSRVFFGGTTVCYNFPDMETAKSLINMENYNEI